MKNKIDQKNFHDIMEIMVVNFGQHYFHNVKFFDIFDQHYENNVDRMNNLHPHYFDFSQHYFCNLTDR